MKKEYFVFVAFVSGFLLNSCLTGSEPNEMYRYRDCNDSFEPHETHRYCDCNGIPKGSTMSLYCEMSRSMTEPNAIKIEFCTYELKNNKKKDLSSGTLWFSNGELFIKRQNPNETYNVATVDGNLYEWHSNKEKGTKYIRYKGDTLDFLHYFVDEGFVKYFSYASYLRSPDDYIVTEEDGRKKIIAKEPLYGFCGIELLENSFWLYSVTFANQKDLSVLSTTVFERPEQVDKIPDDLRKLPDSIVFEESSNTVDIHFGYI